MTKNCTKCGFIGVPENFYVDKSRKDGRHPWCRSCARANVKAQYYKNVDANRQREKDRHLKDAFGLSRDDYNLMLSSQGNVCAICKKSPEGAKRAFCVDHCHRTGKVRGILCHLCNGAIGSLKESELNLLSAISYLRKHNG